MKIITNILFTSYFLILFSYISAQTQEIDSLENLLLQHKKKDTIRVNLLNETANKLYKVDLDKTLKYAEEAGQGYYSELVTIFVGP